MPQTRRRPLLRTPLVALLAVFGALFAAPPRPAHAGGDWNNAGVVWHSYADGIAEAKKSGKPVCLIAFTEWCGHCKNYSAVFHDPKVVEMSKKFVMIRLDQDQNKDVLKDFAPDGQYIPRTMFLSSEGKLDTELRAPRETYRYFYDEGRADGPTGILGGMQRALEKFGGK